MDIEQKKAILHYIKTNDPENEVVKSIVPSHDFLCGKIEYNGQALVLHRQVSLLSDEEYVRAYLLVRLTKTLGYASKKAIEVEKAYSIGRPSRKSARVDLLVKYPSSWPDEKRRGAAFFFIECKSPGKFDSDKDFLKGQLFNLAKQESPFPDFAVYYTTLFESGVLLDRALIINLAEFPSWDKWDEQGQPSNSILPERYGVPKNIEYANIIAPTSKQRPLRTDVTRIEFDRLRKDLHDVIWGGGGTNNNDVFVILVRLFLCRVYDEFEASPGKRYRFQRAAYKNGEVESPEEVLKKMATLFKEAAETYLGYSREELEETTPFESKKVSPAKVAFVVEQLQDISLTKNTHRGEGDLLGDFFEGIVSQDFTQTKGQFFTHLNLVRFCLEICDFRDNVERTFLTERDAQGRPRVPKVIDPSCGSGTFLVEAMKEGTRALVSIRTKGLLQKRLREYAAIWFGEENQNSWAREFIYGLEPNADLGLATKVNMILHGDGSTNIFVKTGLAEFSQYAISDRSHGLAVTRRKGENFPYSKNCNEEFDFIFTNPPFSISLSSDEKKQLAEYFTLDPESSSEHLFVERWYQLLRQRGRFVAIIPETILDSSSSMEIRKFIFQYFNIKAVVSLPYVAFKPFTSTKTCILYAEKKTDEQVINWNKAWKIREAEYNVLLKSYRSKNPQVQFNAILELLGLNRTARFELKDVLQKYGNDLEEISKDGSSWIFRQVVKTSEIDNYEIFFAEPHYVGYKRRKGLSDLTQQNDLISLQSASSILNNYRNLKTESLRFGFKVRLSELGIRPGLRLDPKYLHLWIKRLGKIFDTTKNSTEIRTLLTPYKAIKLPKGTLDRPRLLIDLANVESRMSIVSDLVEVDEVGSDRIEFGNADIAISKLEPYLGKVLVIEKEKEWIGSPEWLTYNLSTHIQDIEYLRFLLLTPEMLEVYRCLQSGKRHARMSESDFLSLRIPVNDPATQKRVADICRRKIKAILEKRAEIESLRDNIDSSLIQAMKV
jgi:type I restriction enzyme M protein